MALSMRRPQSGGDKSLLLCQDERAKASQVPMRRAWSDRAYPGACGAVLAAPYQRGTGSGGSLGDMQWTASRPQPRDFTLGSCGHAVRAHDCRSQQFAT